MPFIPSAPSAMDLDTELSRSMAAYELRRDLPTRPRPALDSSRSGMIHDALGLRFDDSLGKNKGPGLHHLIEDDHDASTPRRPVISRGNSYDCGQSDTTCSSFVLLTRDNTPTDMAANSDNSPDAAPAPEAPRDGFDQPSQPIVPFGSTPFGSNVNANQAFMTSSGGMHMNMPAGPERPRPVRQGWSDGALFPSPGPPPFPPTSTPFHSSTQFSTTSHFSPGSVPGVPHGIAPMVASHFIQPPQLGYPTSLHMTPVSMQQANQAQTAGIFGSRAPPPPATASLPQSTQIPIQGPQFPPALTPTAILAPDGSQIPLIPKPEEHVPFDPANEAPMQPLRRFDQPGQMAGIGNQDVESELGRIGSSNAKSDSFAVEASKYVQLQFSMTQRHGQACNLCKVRKIKCDTKELGCANCAKIGQPCHDLCRLTGKSVRRGYSKRLEHQISELRKANHILQRRLRNRQEDNDLDAMDTEEEGLSLKAQLLRSMKKNREHSGDLVDVIQDLKERSSGQPGMQSTRLWHNFHILIRRLVGMLHAGFRPSASDLERTQSDIIRVVASLRHQDEVLGDGKRFIESLEMIFAEIFEDLQDLPPNPQSSRSPPQHQTDTLNHPMSSNQSTPTATQPATTGNPTPEKTPFGVTRPGTPIPPSSP